MPMDQRIEREIKPGQGRSPIRDMGKTREKSSKLLCYNNKVSAIKQEISRNSW